MEILVHVICGRIALGRNLEGSEGGRIRQGKELSKDRV